SARLISRIGPGRVSPLPISSRPPPMDSHFSMAVTLVVVGLWASSRNSRFIPSSSVGLAQRGNQLLLAHGGAALDVLGPRLVQQLLLGLVFQRGGARASLAGGGGLFGRVAAVCGLGLLGFLLPRATTAVATAGLLVNRGPGAGFGLVLRHALALVTLLDMLRLALLLVGVLVFVALWHGS